MVLIKRQSVLLILLLNLLLIRDYTETNKDLINFLMNNPETTELDLSNNLLRELPMEITFLSCLSKLNIQNNFFVNVSKSNLISLVWTNCECSFQNKNVKKFKHWFNVFPGSDDDSWKDA